MTHVRNWLIAVAVLVVIGAVLVWTYPWALLVLSIGPLAVIVALVRNRWLAARARRAFVASSGKRILLVYSASPNWQAYIEQRWLPLLRDRVAILNWSERQQWPTRSSVEAAVFRAYAGQREFNPIAIVFPDRGRAEVIRFWQAFRDFKHGKAKPLSIAEAALFAAAGVTPPAPPQ